jgi:transcriptional antiterminator RfaH
MIISPQQLHDAAEPRWFCLRTKPKHEHLATAGLRQLMGVECVCPRIRYRKATRRGAVWFAEALFPGYLFAEFVYSVQHRQVQSAPGILTMLRFGEGVAVIDSETIGRLREAGGEEEVIVFDPPPKVGDEVRIAEGCFEGLQAVITELLPARDRVKVLLEFLGRSVEAEIAAPKVISPLSPRAAAGLGRIPAL